MRQFGHDYLHCQSQLQPNHKSPTILTTEHGGGNVSSPSCISVIELTPEQQSELWEELGNHHFGPLFSPFFDTLFLQRALSQTHFYLQNPQALFPLFTLTYKRQSIFVVLVLQVFTFISGQALNSGTHLGKLKFKHQY